MRIFIFPVRFSVLFPGLHQLNLCCSIWSFTTSFAHKKLAAKIVKSVPETDACSFNTATDKQTIFGVSWTSAKTLLFMSARFVFIVKYVIKRIKNRIFILYKGCNKSDFVWCFVSYAGAPSYCNKESKTCIENISS